MTSLVTAFPLTRVSHSPLDMAVIGEMRLEWPRLAKQIMAVLSLQTLRIPGANPECVMDEETSVNMRVVQTSLA